MKKVALMIVMSAISVGLFAQSANDRRGFQGVVTATLKHTIKPEGKEEAQVNATIEFTGRAIVVEGDTYDIVKKTFDGKDKTVFTCTKRRATYEISYTVGQSIRIVDTGNKDMVTEYRSLKEK
ncbi:MAG: hypothetical protein M9954_06000 [Cyclobacteriaceae bacterium]|nr:hypothetical protein [Cyclobacteriaceae bacterium]MCB0499653.1 hypothetical protein [Cyclobacteriaceae bacterium]MCB9239422.1 hypothetical protein [Flammeovirgaceae bacterium]MCO5271195.1 hypothetical protein [Cyclobacteriaceae bacterium]MCW5902599.1 hypothetical protein [Cyclobacteriaceae bacterium]